MTQVWRPKPNKLTTLSADNPGYWRILVKRSQYTEAEITQALADGEAVNDRVQAFLEEAYSLLVWEDGRSMGYHNSQYTDYASDAHSTLAMHILQTHYVGLSTSENSHLNCFPVQKWRKQIAAADR